MTKLLLPLLFLFPAGATAQPPFDLNAVTLETVSQLPLPEAPSVAVPLRAGLRGDDKYFNGYVLKAIDYLYKNYGLLGYDISSILTHDIESSPPSTSTPRRPATIPSTIIFRSAASRAWLLPTSRAISG